MLLQIVREVLCPMSGLQTKIYEVMRASVEAEETDDDDSRWGPDCGPDSDLSSVSDEAQRRATGGRKMFSLSFNNILMQLRKLCNHPVSS